ncbi:hypothetical protein RJ639_046645 [Escallonia herrerae]|uniref:rRNA adenine N(6)-methyltransferase n=1 Tax=Escallonia herrerae TaxID=1293975 RepID=A0AA88WBD9_9ASTE|nr:hypothetical protein RJ639_046645 [Escallonia herrerae]
MCCVLQSLAQISAFIPPEVNRYPSASVHNTTRRQKNALKIVASTGAKTRSQEDDYHATLEALNSKGRTPRKSLGQHYMLNSAVNEQLAAAADVKEGDVVLEIGPGTGSLTNVLVDSGATVIAIEKDPYMAALVRERFANTGRVEVGPFLFLLLWATSD